MENLPGDVLIEIFVRLLAKQLAQMRCVCKSWDALLSQSSFIKSHLNHSIHKNDEILLFFRHGFLFDCSPFAAQPSRFPNLKLTNFIKFPVNPQSKSSQGKVIGSVNGLICFSYGSYNDIVICIWNPSLSAMLTLPPCSLCSPQLRKTHFRFGYDPKTDDYKVVKLSSLYSPYKMVPQGEVYSMRKGSWEFVSQRFPSHVTIISDKVEVCGDGHDGHLHWLCRIDEKMKAQTIVSFNLGAETFREIPLPDSLPHHHGYRFNVLGVLGGKLCLMSSFYGGEGPEGRKYEVWVMDVNEVAKSWVKHHVMSRFSGNVIPYGFTVHSEFLFQVAIDRFGLYDPMADKTRTINIMDRNFRTSLYKIVEYVDSLVWVAPAKREMSCSF